MIVHHHRKVIGGHAVSFHQHLHVNLRVGDTDFSAQTIGERTVTLFRYPHTNHVSLTCGDARSNLVGT